MWANRRWVLLAAACAVNVFWAVTIPRESFGTLALLSFGVYAVGAILSLPRRAIPAAGVLCVTAYLALSWLNNEKYRLTALPVTDLDIQLALENPGGLVQAVGLTGWKGSAVLVVALLSVIGVVAMIIRSLVGSLKAAAKPQGTRRMIARGIPALGLVVSAAVFLQQFTGAARVFAGTQVGLDEPGAFFSLSRSLSLPGFFVYSFHLRGQDPAELFRGPSGATPPSAEDIGKAVRAHVAFGAESTRVLPNIVVVQAESTLNPAQIFKLRAPIRNSLFESQALTRALGPLLVNPVGGGSWISEFEFVTGLDSRLFGYAGQYTHVALAPLVRQSLFTYLKAHGYWTDAFYAADGDFYRAAEAFGHYGVDRFVPNPTGTVWERDDERLIDAVIDQSTARDGPTMTYVVTIGNHWPHDCEHFQSAGELLASFAGSEGFSEPNCALSEYVRKLQQTERAWLRLRAHLESEEARTGRPYVLLIYGDHQPSTFAAPPMGDDEGGSRRFSAFRSRPDDRETFFHLVSSAASPLTCCETRPHLTLLPTMLSAFVARDVADLYLPVNFYGLAACGSDVFGCGAFDALRAAYRDAGIVGR